MLFGEGSQILHKVQIGVKIRIMSKIKKLKWRKEGVICERDSEFDLRSFKEQNRGIKMIRRLILIQNNKFSKKSCFPVVQ